LSLFHTPGCIPTMVPTHIPTRVPTHIPHHGTYAHTHHGHTPYIPTMVTPRTYPPLYTLGYTPCGIHHC